MEVRQLNNCPRHVHLVTLRARVRLVGINMKTKINAHSFEYLAWFLGECRSDADLRRFDSLQLRYHIKGYTRPILDHFKQH